MRFDNYLSSINVAELKPMTRLWVDKAPARKDECIRVIERGLADPALVRRAVASLRPYEHAALALLKQQGGKMDPQALNVALHATGLPLPNEPASNYYSYNFGYYQAPSIIQSLMKRGLVMLEPLQNSYYGSFQPRALVADERLLAEVGPLELPPLSLPPVSKATDSSFRRPHNVMFDLVSLLQAVESLGSLNLTKNGTVRVADLRKLAKAMRWGEDATYDGLSLPNPALGFVSAMRHAGLLHPRHDGLVLRDPVQLTTVRPPQELVSALAQGFAAADDWVEWGEGHAYGPPSHVQGRAALLQILANMPLERPFVRFDDFDRLVFERIGAIFSVGYAAPRPYPYGRQAADVAREEEKWHKQRRAEWSKRERNWLSMALTSWLYALGLLECAFAHDELAAFRLTELGQAVLQPGVGGEVASAPDGGAGAWIVQPNFEIIVYLDRATPKQVAFLERHAERVQMQQHTANYRLSRESVYQALEGGSEVDLLLTTLRSGAGVALPQNIEAEIQGWAALRERITMRRRAALLEFPNAAAREKAVADGVVGTPIGDTFLLLATPDPNIVRPAERIDYAQRLPPSLTTREDGQVILSRPAQDMLLRSQIERWAAPQDDGSWRFTAETVGVAIRAGGTVGQLFTMLSERLVTPLPPLLAVALRAWAGERIAVELGQALLLRCPAPDVFAALAHSPRLRPYLRGELGPDLLLVDPAALALLQEELAWLGLSVGDVIHGRKVRG